MVVKMPRNSGTSVWPERSDSRPFYNLPARAGRYMYTHYDGIGLCPPPKLADESKNKRVAGVREGVRW